MHPRFAQAAELKETLEHARALNHGGGDGTSDRISDRVTRLEADMHYVRRDLDSINGKLDKLIDRTANLPTKADLWAWKWQWTALAFAMIAIVIGGIIGGLAWIQPTPSAPTPIVVQAIPAVAGASSIKH